jgi:signal transduction protein with GAF and PtsI domain
MASDESHCPTEAEIQKLIERVRHEQSSGAAAQAQVDAALAKQLSYHIQRLSEVIGTSASQLARGTNRITEAIEKFDDSATRDVERLTQALDNFRKSMDNSSEKMARLTNRLVVFTAVLAVFTAILALKDLDIASWLEWSWAAIQSWRRWFTYYFPPCPYHFRGILEYSGTQYQLFLTEDLGLD